ncbi:MAG: TonB-dependent receptor, partial [Pyrinomonadaceae bacterium]
DLDPQPGQAIIPRNYGRGPGFFSVNMRLSKTIGFGELASAGAGGAGGGGGETFGGESTEHRYNLTLSMSVQNLFNHPSLGTPVGNLNSPFFGQSVSGGGRFGFGGGGGQNGGARRVDLQLRFSF